MMPLQSNGTNYTDKDNIMVAKRPTGERPKQLSKLASKVYMKETKITQGIVVVFPKQEKCSVVFKWITL
jgi:hypothetical protein